LELCLALIDLNVPPQESDRQLLEFLDSAERVCLVVGTKADKLSGNALRKSLDAFREAAPEVRVLPFSARTGQGRDELWQEIRAACQSEVNLPRQAAL
jgi:GTP-binding protein